MKWISTVKAARILNRSRNGVIHLIDKYKLKTKWEVRNNRKVLLLLEHECKALAPKLRPRRFSSRTMNRVVEKGTGYIKIYMPEHPRAVAGGYVYEHWLVAEKMLGRDLTKQEQVHHINRVRDDNRPENLHVYPSRSAHMKEAHNQLKEFLSKALSTPTEKAE